MLLCFKFNSLLAPIVEVKAFIMDSQISRMIINRKLQLYFLNILLLINNSSVAKLKLDLPSEWKIYKNKMIGKLS